MPFAIPPAVAAGSLSASPQPTLRSEDGALTLRPWTADDVPVLLSAFEDPTIRHWHVRQVHTREEALAWIEESGQSWREERAAQFLVTGPDGGPALGRVAVRDMDRTHGVAECGYWVLPHARGAGVASRALSTVADWALAPGRFHRLELDHSVHNAASCRVAVKSGFALEGTRRSAHVHADGRHDMHLHARLRTPHTDPPPA